MQRVPQIRIFGSSGYEWRRGSIQKNDRRFENTWTSSVSSPFTLTKTYEQPSYNNTKMSFMKRSSSVTKLRENIKPFETNYYANAVKICDNNKVLNNIKGHGMEFLNSSYIVKGCRRPVKKQCVQCQTQARNGALMKENCKGIHPSQPSTFNPYLYQNRIQNKAEFQYEQSSYRTSKQSETNYMNYYEEQQRMNSNRNSQQQNNTPKIKATHSQKKIVSFQEIIQSATQLKQPTFRPNEQSRQQHFKQICTQKNFNQNQNNNNNQQQNILIIESKCQSMIDKSKYSQNQQNIKKSRVKQSSLLPEISCLINQLNLIGSLGQVETTTAFMLDELKQAARKDLQVRKNCINRLDEIIGKYGSAQKQNSHIQVVRFS